MEGMDPDFDEHLEAWQAWKKDGKPSSLKKVVVGLEPIVQSTLRSAGIRSPVVADRARIMAAKAVKTYDPTKNAKVSTHVHSYLRGVVRDSVKIQEPMVAPEGYRRESSDLMNATAQFSDKIGRDPTDEELSDITNIPLRKVIKIRTGVRSRVPMSVIEEAGDGEDDAGSDIIGSTRTGYNDWEEAVYHGLGDVDRLILMHRTGYRGTPVLDNNKIAETLRMSPSAVSSRAKHIQEQLDQYQR